ncbi:MAG: transcription termination/antitermination factor NusG [Lachnospiraceae bacterium]|nr:transcription termination/antitermination factor NusG [Lachnospiraceae bacterium]
MAAQTDAQQAGDVPAAGEAEAVTGEAEAAAGEAAAPVAAPAQAADGAEGEGDTGKKKYWYVVHTYSGYENKVKANLEKAIENRHLEDQIVEIRIPMQDVIETKNGKRRPVQRKMFPGYVLVNMDMNDDTWFVVRNTRGVTGFVGPGSKAVPLSDAEIKPLGIKTENVTVDFKVGDLIAVIAGVWKDTTGVVQRMDMSKQTATINVELFGRDTPVEISFAEVRRLDRR